MTLPTGRPRTSTLVLLAVFVVTFAVYLAVRPPRVVVRDPLTGAVVAVRPATPDEPTTTSRPADPATTGSVPVDEGGPVDTPVETIPGPGPGPGPEPGGTTTPTASTTTTTTAPTTTTTAGTTTTASNGPTTAGSAG